MRAYILAITVTCLAISCKDKSAEKKNGPATPVTADTARLVPDTSKAVVNDTGNHALLSIGEEVLKAFKNKDYARLAAIAHPDGVRFSPYAYIDSTHDKVIDVASLQLWADPKKRAKILWGTTDPQSENIKGTIDDYSKRFVYDVDFLTAPKKQVNNSTHAGTTLNNIDAFYPGDEYAEFYFPGFDEKYGGMDYRTLRLVFRQLNGIYRLVGVIHDEWTP